MSQAADKTLVQKFLELELCNREDFIVSYFFAEPLRYVPLWALLDIYSIDRAAFTRALEIVLVRKPGFDMALRFMVWIKIREGDFPAALTLLRRLIEVVPADPLERRKLLRIGVLSPELMTSELIEIGQTGLTNDLVKASYRFQIARAQRASNLIEVLNILRDVMHTTGEGLREQIRYEAAKNEHVSPLTELLRTLDGARRIALVGNGPSLRGQQRGQEIDRYDLVIRFNFPAIRDYRVDVGSKTDVVVFTEALLREFEKRVSTEPCYRTVHLASVENPVAAAGLDPEIIAEASGTKIARFPQLVHEMVKNISYDNLTTGMMMYLLFCCLLEKSVTLFGFDFYSQPNSHYFGGGVPPWLGHEVEYERFVFRDLVKPVFRAYSR